MPSGVNEVGRTAGVVDLVFERGARWLRPIIWWDLFYEEGDVRNVRKNLTGYTQPRLEVRNRKLDTAIAFLATDAVPNNYLTPDLVNGEILVDIPSSVTTTLPSWEVSRGHFQFTLIDPEGQVVRLLEGRVAVV